MKKKLSAISLIAAMSLSLVSCGTEPETEAEISIPDNSFNSSEEETPAVSEESSEGTEDTVKPIEPLPEILEADIADRKVQIGDFVVEFPITVDKLLASGVRITDDKIPDATVLEPNTSYSVSFDFGSRIFALSANNDDETQKLLKDCSIYSPACWDAEARDYYDNPDMIYSKGIKVGSTVDELKAAWGEPDPESDLNTYRYTDPEYIYIIKIDLASNSIADIGFSYDYLDNY